MSAPLLSHYLLGNVNLSIINESAFVGGQSSIELLEDEKPVVTVAEEMIHLYSRSFVNRYGFELTDVNKGLYRPKKLEYCFNV